MNQFDKLKKIEFLIDDLQSNIRKLETRLSNIESDISILKFETTSLYLNVDGYKRELYTKDQTNIYKQHMINHLKTIKDELTKKIACEKANVYNIKLKFS